MANTSEIKNGLCIEYSNDIYSVVEFQHVKPGKGNAFVRTKMKSLTSGKVIDQTFPAGHKITIVRVERRKYQYLYRDETGFHFMNNETYNQTVLSEHMLTNSDLLKEGEIVDVLFHSKDDLPISCDMPQYVYLEVTYTEPGIKGDTANAAMKPATMETGAIVKVPLFINNGDLIKVETSTKSYMERAKK